MQRTLFIIPVPDEIFGLPVVGLGWLLILWVVVVAVWLGVLVRRHGWSQETLGHLPLFVVVAAAIVFVLPVLRVEEGGQVGFPIRGYGVMLVVGIISAVGLAAWRAQKMGIHPEIIYSLAMVLIVSGVVGARIFFVLQYWENFYVPGDWRATLSEIFRVTEGGIVVYGSLIGGAVGYLVYCYRKRLPVLALADLVAPSLLVGLMFGRLGCFLNGCCYGGLCALPVGVAFPQGLPQQYTPPYVRHMENGAFYGLVLGVDPQGQVRVTSILEDSPASQNPTLEVGDVVQRINGQVLVGQKDPDTARDIPPMAIVSRILYQSWRPGQSPAGSLVLDLAEKGRVPLTVDQMPAQSLQVHPTQLYSSVNALILCLLVLAYYPLRRYDGEVIALTLGMYAVTRFLLEVIRTDEYAIGGTGLTISQNVSIVIFVLMAALWIGIRIRKQPLAWPRTAT